MLINGKDMPFIYFLMCFILSWFKNLGKIPLNLLDRGFYSYLTRKLWIGQFIPDMYLHPHSCIYFSVNNIHAYNKLRYKSLALPWEYTTHDSDKKTMKDEEHAYYDAHFQ